MKRSVLIVILIIIAFCAYGQNSTPIDLILLLDSSTDMGSSYENVNNYITGAFLSEYLRVGDTFHLITFSGASRLDIARRVTGRGDVETIIGRMFLQYPLETGRDAAKAISFTEDYIASLPSRPKKIVMISTGGSDINNLVNAAKQRLNSKNTTLDFVSVSPGQPLANLPSSNRPELRTAPSVSQATPPPPAQTTTTPPAQTTTPSPTQTTTTPPAQTTTPSPAQTTTPSPAQTTTPSPSQTTTVSPAQTTSPTQTTTTTPSPSQTSTVSPSQTTSPTQTTTPPAQTTTTPPAQTTTSSPAQTTTSPAQTTTPSPSQTTTTPPAQTTTPSPAQILETEPAAQPSSAGLPAITETAGIVPERDLSLSEENSGAGVSQGVSQGEAQGEAQRETNVPSDEKPDTEITPAASEKPQASGKKWTSSIPFIIGIVVLVLLIALLIFFASRKLGSTPNRVMAATSSPSPEPAKDEAAPVNRSSDLAKYAEGQNRQRTTPYQNRPVKTDNTKPPVINPSGPLLINLFVEDQNTAIGKRNIHSLKSGYSLTIGGGKSDFLIFLVPVPAKIGEIRRDGSQCSFIPRKHKYFPDLGSNELKDCLNKTIRIISDRKYELRFRFEMYEDPLVALNRLLHSVKVPG